jgi:HD superfamily phosphohydrolase
VPSKLKIINDPVHGFIKLTTGFIFDLLEHPYVQRLRRIKQLGLTSLVYPGAMHTRFQHALGAYHLMNQAIDNIRQKGFEINDAEAEAVSAAILLHDIGHGPFSHALEQTIIPEIKHEELSLILMHRLNDEFNGNLGLALSIFKNQYQKKYLHQLVSSQLDMDRMDYLMRDSFYTGVAEGTIGTERIIKMLNVFDNELVVESKGIYSIEKFLIARRMMYWQVYFHKTVIAAENILVKTLQRAVDLIRTGRKIAATESLEFFLYNRIDNIAFKSNLENIINQFASLDDDEFIISAKMWSHHSDKLIAYMAGSLLRRNLPKVIIQDKPFEKQLVDKIKDKVTDTFKIDPEDTGYLVYEGSISNHAYNGQDDKIKILYNNGVIKDLAEASDIFNVSLLTQPSVKYFLCYPKECAV